MAGRAESGNEEGRFVGAEDISLYECIGLWLAADDWRYGDESDANWHGGY